MVLLHQPGRPRVRQRIDAHHHLWQLGRFPYPWLAPGSPPRPFGDHSVLQRDYLLADYLRDMADLGIVASVFVEANAGAPGTSELDWVDAVAATGFPSASIGSADLRRPDLAAVLDRFAASRRMRGVRMSLCWDERPEWRFIDRPDVMRSEAFRDGLRELTRRGMIFDVLVVPGQLGELAALAAANPDQQFLLNHLGTPLQQPADRAEWAAGMGDCARCPNLSVKLSGLWVIDRRWRPERIAGPVRRVVDLFGPDRCLWASNYPVEKLMCPVRDQIASLEEVLSDLGEADRDRIFRDTAARIYRIPVANDAIPAS
jgi:predicted TIM-barrel fold metal-dependent hydrolase